MWGTLCGLLVLAPETCHLVVQRKTTEGGWPKQGEGEVMIFRFFLCVGG